MGSVTFIRELVPRRLVATAAQITYNEPYRTVPMFHRLDLSESNETKRASYEWRDGTKYGVLRVEADGRGEPLVPGSFEDFLTHREWGYTRQRDGSTVEYQVEHPPWRVWSCVDARVDCDVAPLYGQPFIEALGGRPTSAFVADGSEVTVRRGRQLA